MTPKSRRVVAGGVLATAMLAWSTFSFSQVAVSPQPVDPVVLTGSDIGFRMTARKGGTPVGQLVVRVDGGWKEVEFSQGMKLITK